MPTESHRKQLVTVGNPAQETHSFESERELLYQILFDLRREVADLKRYVYQQRSGSGSEIEHLPQPSVSPRHDAVLYDDHNPSVKFGQRSSVDANVPYWEAEEVKEDEQPTLDGSVLSMSASLEGREGKMPQSLDDLERDMIRRALDVNNGRRKAAAEQLGISERTLYRKIKEYGLE